MRYSKQRELILNAVLEHPIHPTAEQIYDMLKEKHEELSLGTVYRNLNVLAENKMLKKIRIPDGSDRFDGTLAAHQHLVCVKCGKILDIYVSELEKVHKNVLDKMDFDIDCTSLAFGGLCSGCKSK